MIGKRPQGGDSPNENSHACTAIAGYIFKRLGIFYMARNNEKGSILPVAAGMLP